MVSVVVENDVDHWISTYNAVVVNKSNSEVIVTKTPTLFTADHVAVLIISLLPC